MAGKDLTSHKSWDAMRTAKEESYFEQKNREKLMKLAQGIEERFEAYAEEEEKAESTDSDIDKSEDKAPH